MSCRKFFFSFLFAFSVLLSGSLIITKNASAVSDIVYTFNSGDTMPSTMSNHLFNCTGACLSQYRYLIVNFTSSFSDTNSYGIFFIFRGFTSNPNCGSGTGQSLYHFSRYTGNYAIIDFSNYAMCSDGEFSPRSYFYLSSGTFPASGSFTLTDTLPSSGVTPSGSISITSNGTYDVSTFAEAIVSVPAEIVYGDYHNDLISIYHAIIICAGVILVLYFFYCIYRLIIKNTGGI